MGYFEDLYTNREEEKRIAEEALSVTKYNYELDKIQEIIAAIIANAETQHPDTCCWITIDGMRHVSWIVYEWGYDVVSYVVLLTDGRLAYVEDKYNLDIPSKRNDCDNHFISMDHIDNLSGSGPIDINRYKLVDLRKSMVNCARNDFGVLIKKTWTGNPGKPKGLLSKILGY